MKMEKLLNIMVVEDDEVDTLNIKRAFKKNNIRNKVIYATNGLEAWEILKGINTEYADLDTPKVILLDINMPKMNGLELLEKIRADEVLKPLSVFILTTSDDDSDKYRAKNLNVAGYIIKPVDFQKFVQAVATLNNYWALIEH